jgi:hypothetical protein
MGAARHAERPNSTPARTPASTHGRAVGTSAGRPSDDSISSRTASHTISAAGRIHSRHAGGTGTGSQGSSRNPRSSTGHSDAPARHRARTPSAAAHATAKATGETGNTASRGPPAAARPIVPSESQAARAARAAAARGAVRDMQRAGRRVWTDGRHVVAGGTYRSLELGHSTCRPARTPLGDASYGPSSRAPPPSAWPS